MKEKQKSNTVILTIILSATFLVVMVGATFAYFTAKVKEYKKIGVALVTSPFELTAEQKTKIEKKLLDTTDYKKMEITYREDKTLIGGLVIRIGDRVIDTSIKSRLEELRLQLMGISLEA